MPRRGSPSKKGEESAIAALSMLMERGGKSLSKDELVQALTEDKALLEGLVSKNMDLFQHAVNESRHKQTIEEKVNLNPTDFIVGFKGNLFTRFRAAFLDTLYEYVVQDEERASILRDQKSKAEAYASFEEAFEVQSYVSCAENALNEVFEELDKDIAGGFLVPRFGALDRATHDQGTKGTDATPSKKASSPPPSKKRSPRRSAAKSLSASSMLSDEETSDEELPGNTRTSEEEEDLEATQAPEAEPKESATSPPKSANTKKRLSQDSAASTSSPGKKRRGRPKKGPDMELYQGLGVLLHDVIRNEWNEFTIAPRASDMTITMTTARRALSAGNLRAVGSVV
jgi:hypothetical protein